MKATLPLWASICALVLTGCGRPPLVDGMWVRRVGAASSNAGLITVFTAIEVSNSQANVIVWQGVDRRGKTQPTSQGIQWEKRIDGRLQHLDHHQYKAAEPGEKPKLSYFFVTNDEGGLDVKQAISDGKGPTQLQTEVPYFKAAKLPTTQADYDSLVAAP